MKKMLVLVVCATALAVGGCGGDGGPGPDPLPPSVPSAAITATGDGAIVVHPSLSPQWVTKIYVPIAIQETAGGTATWNYARLSRWLDGAEVGRGEIGADVLASPPSWADIGARQDESYALVFGFNTGDFDTLTLTLGFSDKKDGRQFEAEVPFESFSGVNISLEPLSLPAQSVHRLE